MTKTIVSLVCMCLGASNMALSLFALAYPEGMPTHVEPSWVSVFISASLTLYFGAVIATSK